MLGVIEVTARVYLKIAEQGRAGRGRQIRGEQLRGVEFAQWADVGEKLFETAEEKFGEVQGRVGHVGVRVVVELAQVVEGGWLLGWLGGGLWRVFLVG